jgi:His/Glu/Gln/Arg/opine family amino acid ABC transporter permease subunit
MLEGFIPQLLAGTWITIKLALCALILGLLFGILGALAKLSPIKTLQWFGNGLTSIIRGLPELLVIFFIYFGGTLILSKLFGTYIEISAFISGVAALGLIFGAYASETLRGAYLAIPRGQLEAAIAFGFSHGKTFYYILLPQIWSHALPGLCNLWFVLLKDTALVSLIGLADLMRVAQNATAFSNRPFTFYLTAAGIYLVLTSISLLFAGRIEQRVNRHRVRN